MKLIRLIIIFVCASLLFVGCGKSEADIEVREPVIMGMACFDDYALLLRLYDGKYESIYSPGSDFGPNWTGQYELLVMELGTNAVLNRHLLTEWEEPLQFHESFELQLTDLNSDGCLEVLIGQYATNNYNLYKMYYVDTDLQIGYYSEIGDIEMSRREMSPCLEVSGDKVIYSVYDNAKGEWITEEIDLDALAIP